MQLIVAIILAILAIFIFLAQRLGNETLQRAGNVGSLTAAVIGLIVLAFYTPALLRQDAQATPTSLLTNPAETEQVVGVSTSTQPQPSLPIEQLPVKVFVYDGRAKNEGGWSYLQISFLKAIPYYEFSYTVLDEESTGYAGMAFQFTEGQNLSDYQHLDKSNLERSSSSRSIRRAQLTTFGGGGGYRAAWQELARTLPHGIGFLKLMVQNEYLK